MLTSTAIAVILFPIVWEGIDKASDYMARAAWSALNK